MKHHVQTSPYPLAGFYLGADVLGSSPNSRPAKDGKNMEKSTGCLKQLWLAPSALSAPSRPAHGLEMAMVQSFRSLSREHSFRNKQSGCCLFIPQTEGMDRKNLQNLPNQQDQQADSLGILQSKHFGCGRLSGLDRFLGSFLNILNILNLAHVTSARAGILSFTALLRKAPKTLWLQWQMSSYPSETCSLRSSFHELQIRTQVVRYQALRQSFTGRGIYFGCRRYIYLPLTLARPVVNHLANLGNAFPFFRF